MPRGKKRESRPEVFPFWSGVISFGLVSVPVNLYPATRHSGSSLRMLSKQGRPLKREYFDPKTDKKVPYERLKRGYEVEKERYVTITDDELEAAAPEKSREIDLKRFVNPDDIPRTFFEKGYFLTPAGDTTKAYRLLAAAMEEANRAGIATFVMRGREYLVAILALDGILRMETMRFADEIRSPDDIGLPEPSKAKAAEVKAFEKAMKKLGADELDEKELEDPQAKAFEKLVKAKLKKKADVVKAPAAEKEEYEGETEVIDLIETIRASLRDEA